MKNYVQIIDALKQALDDAGYEYHHIDAHHLDTLQQYIVYVTSIDGRVMTHTLSVADEMDKIVAKYKDFMPPKVSCHGAFSVCQGNEVSEIRADELLENDKFRRLLIDIVRKKQNAGKQSY